MFKKILAVILVVMMSLFSFGCGGNQLLRVVYSVQGGCVEFKFWTLDSSVSNIILLNINDDVIAYCKTDYGLFGSFVQKGNGKEIVIKNKQEFFWQIYTKTEKEKVEKNCANIEIILHKRERIVGNISIKIYYNGCYIPTVEKMELSEDFYV